jgi:hypothetical protein
VTGDRSLGRKKGGSAALFVFSADPVRSGAEIARDFRCPGVVRTTQAPPVKEKIFSGRSLHAVVSKSD